MKTCYCCGLEEFKHSDVPLEPFELRRENTEGGIDTTNIEAHASCFDFFMSKRPNPLRAEHESTLRPIEQRTK